MTEDQGILQWCKDIIEGVGGMDDFEKYELPIWQYPDRIEAAIWTLKCLANPRNEGSEEVLQAIIQRRKDVVRGVEDLCPTCLNHAVQKPKGHPGGCAVYDRT